jgi:FAD/FMN-containing dehydrogenase
LQNYWKSAFLDGLSDAALDSLIRAAAAIRSPLAALHVHHMQGAVSRVNAEATAFGNRGAAFVLNIVGLWPDPADSPANIAWVRDIHSTMRPHANGSTYVNFIADEGQDRVRAAYTRPAYERLVALKCEYDPTSLFHLNQNIRPD